MPAYSEKAQPYLDAIACGVFSSEAVRNWLILGTSAQETYESARVLIDEQRAVRRASKPTKQPFWANYWCGKDTRCECRIDGSKGLESDAIFFFENLKGRRLAVHVEYKHPQESFGYGQAECYPLRAACFAKTHRQRKTLNAHDDWTTVIFCGDESLQDQRLRNFERIIPYSEAQQNLSGWPV